MQDPGRYDVIVTDNLFGDILTDLGGAVSGGIGFAASANLNPARTGAVDVRAGARLGARHRRPGQGQPRRGRCSRPRMMLDFLGEAAAAARIRAACADTSVLTGSTATDRRRHRRPPVAHATRHPRGPDMPITPTAKIWMNGELVDWDDARIHVLTHTLHYGMGVFEGIRAYETSEGPAVFRLTDHIERLAQLGARS